jgi:hypothetical protein
MANDSVSRQLPSSMVAEEFGEVNVRRVGSQVEVLFTILMEPQGDEAEGWQTGVALDGSASMKAWYGRGLEGSVPPGPMQEYVRRGWVRERNLDGRTVQSFQEEAFEDAIARGYLRRTPNIMEPKSREFISYLADNLDADGGTTVIYWACGDGSDYEVLGDFTGEQCRNLKVDGPHHTSFGTGTCLEPAARYFVNRFHDAQRGMYVFLTDGRLDDLEAVKRYTIRLCKEIASGKRYPVKFVLIGVGDKIDAGQMEELDDLESGTEVDIWDHKIATEMRNLVEIFAEVVDENQIVAPTAYLYDASGKVVKSFADGLPARVTFTMPASSSYFELEVGGERIRQAVQMTRLR